jgi:hypothetical protein
MDPQADAVGMPPAPVRVAPAYAPADPAALSISRCFDDAGAVFSRNVVLLLVAGLVTQLLSLATLLVLAGPLCGGAALLSLRGLLRPDKRIELGDLFGTMGRFLPMAGLFFLMLIAEAVGLMALIVPGLILMTFWLFPYYVMVDKDLGAIDALSASWTIVRRRGFRPNFYLALIVFALAVAASLIPYVSFLIGCVTLPLTWLLVGSAYIQQVREKEADLQDLFPQGFPVNSAA